MKFKVGDRVKIKKKSKLLLLDEIFFEDVFAEVVRISHYGKPYLKCKSGLSLFISENELLYIKKANKDYKIYCLEKEIENLREKLNNKG